MQDTVLTLATGLLMGALYGGYAVYAMMKKGVRDIVLETLSNVGLLMAMGLFYVLVRRYQEERARMAFTGVVCLQDRNEVFVGL